LNRFLEQAQNWAGKVTWKLQKKVFAHAILFRNPEQLKGEMGKLGLKV